MNDADRNRGIYNKYAVTRRDFSDKHTDCHYFVLDLVHDKFAAAALRAYAPTPASVSTRSLQRIFRSRRRRTF